MSFASFPLETLGLRKDHVAACARANIYTASEVLLLPTHELTRRLKWRLDVVQTLVRDVSRAISPRTSVVGGLCAGVDEVPEGSEGDKSPEGPEGLEGAAATQLPPTAASHPVTATAIAGPSSSNAGPSRIRDVGLQHHARQRSRSSSISGVGGRELVLPRYAQGDWIRTGDAEWDRLLGGGLRLGTIVEITGESAAGKSHLALSFACASQLPALTSLPGGTIVLTSEREISATRLKDVARYMLKTHGKNDFRTPNRLMNGVLTNRVADIEALEHALSYGIPALLERAAKAGIRKSRRKSKSAGNGGRNGDVNGDGTEHGQAMAAPPDPSTHNEGSSGNDKLPSRLMGFPPPSHVLSEYDNARGFGSERLASLSQSLSSTNPAQAQTRTNLAHNPKAPIRLIVLDSITALLRGAETAYSSSSAGLTARSRFMCVIADKLKALAVEYNLAVVIINQVSDVFDRRPFGGIPPSVPDDDDGDGGVADQAIVGHEQVDHLRLNPSQSLSQRQQTNQQPGSSQASGLTHSQAWYTVGDDPPMLYATQSKWFSGQASAKTKEAALGVVWANAVNVRIMLSRTGRRRVVREGEVQAGASRASRMMLGELSDAMRIEAERDGGGGMRRRLGGGGEDEGQVVWDAELSRGSGMIGHSDAQARGEEEEVGERMLIRRAHIVFSPFSPSATVDFVITATGAHAIKETYKLMESGEEMMKRYKRRARAEVGGGGGDGDDGDGAEGQGGKEGGRGEEEYDDLFGEIRGLEDVPDEWWNGNGNGNVNGQGSGSGSGSGSGQLGNGNGNGG